MKRTFIIILVLIGCTNLTNAQLRIAEHTIGLRAGGGDGFGTEFSYQQAIGSDFNRLEINLGYESGDKFQGFKAVGTYQWIWELEGRFNWYAGAGGGIASASYDEPFDGRDDDTETALFLAGQIGIEYQFNFPLVLSLDSRPEVFFGDFRNDFEIFRIALGVRYAF